MGFAASEVVILLLFFFSTAKSIFNDSYLQNQHLSAEVVCFDSHTTTSMLLWLSILV